MRLGKVLTRHTLQTPGLPNHPDFAVTVLSNLFVQRNKKMLLNLVQIPHRTHSLKLALRKSLHLL
jgi:hypothetical protein